MQAASERVPLESRSTCWNLHKNRCGRFSYLPDNLQWLWLHCQLFKFGSAWLTISSPAALITNPSSHQGASLHVRQRGTAPEKGTPAQPHCAALMAAEPLHTSCTHSSAPCWERAFLPERFWSFAEAGRALVDALCLAHTLTRCRWRRKRAGSPRTGCDCCAGNGSIPVPVTNHRVHPGEVAVKSGHT